MVDLEIPMNLHRVQVERELRLLLQRLRQHVLHAGKNELEYTNILKKTVFGRGHPSTAHASGF